MGNNINKSFNFKNGVQVDTDNFVVNPNGLVGIGTSIPTVILDVYGTAKITGLVTTTNLAVSGVSTFYNDVKVGSAITAVASTGVLYATQFVGSAAGLTGIVAISTNGWIVNAGTLSTESKVGIGTSFPYYSLQVGNDPLTGNGFSVDALSGNVNTTGILTASNLKTIGSITGYNFSGFGTDITGINATNISNGTLNNSRLPSSINLTGIITGYSFSGFGTDITGINATNISNGTLNNSRLPTDLNISGIITANSGVVTSLTAGIASITHLYVSGVTTSLQGFVGNLVGIASTALSLSGSPSITVTNIYSTGIITSSNITSGIITASTRLYAESVGVGTSSPSADIHIHRNSISKLQVTSDTAESIIAIGRSTSLIGSNGALRFGNTSANTPYSTPKSLDIINYDSGNLNFYIQLGSPIQTGTFNWFRGLTAPTSPIMTLTYAGYLGIGITLPQHNIHVSGSSTVSGNSYVGGNFYVAQNVDVSGSITANGFDGNATTATSATTATNAQGLTGTPNITVGIVTATLFVGNGSGLTNLIGVGAGIVVKDSGTTVGTAGTIDFGDNLTVSAISAGIVTVTGSAGGSGSSQFITTAAGIHTLSNVGIGTTNPTSTLTVSGDVKVTGIITATSFRGYSSLVGTASSTTTTFVVTVASKTSNHRYFGTGSESAYFIDGIESPFLTLLPGKTYRFTQDDASNSTHQLLFYYQADKTTQYTTNITTNESAGSAGSAGSYTQIVVTDTTPVVLHYQCSVHGYMGNAAQFSSNVVDTPYQITARSGINVVTGVVTATSFSGSGTALTGIVTSIVAGTNVTISGSEGQFTINSTASGGGGSSQWVTTDVGIHTLSKVGIGTTNPTSELHVVGLVSATSFSGSGSGLTSIPAGNLTGVLPAIDGSALLYLTGVGAGIVVKDSGTTVGTAGTIDFGDNLTVSAISAGIVTVTGSARSVVSATTSSSIANNASANLNITNVAKAYALLNISTNYAAWVTLYTTDANRTSDSSRTEYTDPLPGSGVIAEVITTSGVLSQIITPGIVGWNGDTTPSTTVYAKVVNKSGSAQLITVNLTVIPLEA